MKPIFQVTLALIGLAVVGCAGEDSQAPVSTSPHDTDVVTFLNHSSPSSPLPTAEARVTKEIPTGGGELRLGDIRVKFEGGTLSSPTTFVLTRYDSEAVSFSVEPSTVVLAKPVRISIEHLNDKTTSRQFLRLSFFRRQGIGWLKVLTSGSTDKIEATSPVLGEFTVGSSEDASGVQFIHWLSGPGFETELIEASKGGDVEYGRFKVRFPENALAQNTYITVRDPGDGYVTCQLEPHGIQFQLPVQLEIDLNGLDYLPYEDWSVFWLHEGPDVWEDQHGVFDHGKVKVSLLHFSEYRPGRAGW